MKNGYTKRRQSWNCSHLGQTDDISGGGGDAAATSWQSGGLASKKPPIIVWSNEFVTFWVDDDGRKT